MRSILSRNHVSCARAGGFTLLEILVAMSLLALIAGILMGSLSLTGRSLEGGERKVEATTDMRLAQEFLRTELEGQHPLRWRRLGETPLMFAGEHDSLRFAAAIPQRVAGSGLWYYRLGVVRIGEKPALVLERIVPVVNMLEDPNFEGADRSVLVDDLEELSIAYLGSDAMTANATATWRDRWDDAQRLPLMIRIDVRPRGNLPWPTMYVAPRASPEAGCRAWDAVQQKCISA